MKEQLEAIDKMLDVAISYGYETNIIYQALLCMKENPSLNPAEAFTLSVTKFMVN